MNMYCANCGTQVSTELSYCNRCGFNLKERNKPNTRVVTACLTAITLIGVFGLLVMFFGALALRKADFNQDFIGFFLVFCFLMISFTEFFLFRNLSRFAGLKQSEHTALAPPVPHDLRLAQASSLGEPVPSVTENTTRTLEYARPERQSPKEKR